MVDRCEEKYPVGRTAILVNDAKLTMNMFNGGSSFIDRFRTELEAQQARYGVNLRREEIERLCVYYSLLRAWNSRLHLVAPCSPAEFATRHVLESLLLLPQLREKARVADIGPGAGLPIIPNLIARKDIRATLIEASQKKAVFLREAIRETRTSAQAVVIADRFENVASQEVDYITCRALDRFTEMFPRLVKWAPCGSILLLFGGEDLRKEMERLVEVAAVRIPNTERRFLFVGNARAGLRSQYRLRQRAG